jgi:Zn-dependent protease
LSNLLLAAIAFAVLKTLVETDLADPYPPAGDHLTQVAPREPDGAVYAIAKIASMFLFLNIVLAILNLFPWPPLDGAGVVTGLFPDPMERFYAFVRSQPLLMIAGIVAIWQALDRLYVPVLRAVLDWL